MKSLRFTDEWKKHGLKEGVQFATLTDIIYKTWAGKTAKQYKEYKGLKKENVVRFANLPSFACAKLAASF